MTLSRRDEMALRIVCALFQSPRSTRVADSDKNLQPMGVEELGITAIEVADAMIAKLDEVPMSKPDPQTTTDKLKDLILESAIHFERLFK